VRAIGRPAGAIGSRESLRESFASLRYLSSTAADMGRHATQEGEDPSQLQDLVDTAVQTSVREELGVPAELRAPGNGDGASRR